MISNRFIILLIIFCIPFFSVAQNIKKLKTIIVDAGHGGSDAGACGQYEGSLFSKEKDVTLAISMKVVDELKKQLPEVSVIPTRTTDIFQNVNEKARLANQYKGDLFICIHADSGPLKTARRQIGTHMVTHYKITYKGKGRRKKKISKPYTVEEPLYHYYKLPLERNGSSVWIFAAHKTSDKLKAIVSNEADYNIEIDEKDTTAANEVDFKSPEYAPIVALYAKRFQEKSIKIGQLVDEEIASTGRITYGLNQRQVGIRVLQSTNMPAILIETGFINNYDDERYLNSEKGQQEIAECIARAVKKYKEQIENPKPTND